MTQRLINDVIKPWEELNALLVERFAFQPELSDVTRMTSALAVSIKHQADLRGISRKTIDDASFENRLMSDVADAAKHGSLHDPGRDNTLYVAACFEYDGTRGFRFIRNVVTIRHASLHEHDFMLTSLAATTFWVQCIGFSLGRKLVVAEGSEDFFPSAYLYYNPKFCINMKETRLKVFRRLPDGTYQPFQPPEVLFEVFDLHQNNA